jgi:NADH-quinone oxidoreductase subunit E
MSSVLPDALAKKIDDLAARYPVKQAALLPVLHLVQNEKGFLSPGDERAVAERLGILPLKVREVITFYTMFHRSPVGKYHIQVCTNLSCSLAEGDGLVKHLEARLGIALGGTTTDGKFTLTGVECLGACEQAPCLMINFDYYGNLDASGIDRILEGLA